MFIFRHIEEHFGKPYRNSCGVQFPFPGRTDALKQGWFLHLSKCVIITLMSQ